MEKVRWEEGMWVRYTSENGRYSFEAEIRHIFSSHPKQFNLKLSNEKDEHKQEYANVYQKNCVRVSPPLKSGDLVEWTDPENKEVKITAYVRLDRGEDTGNLYSSPGLEDKPICSINLIDCMILKKAS